MFLPTQLWPDPLLCGKVVFEKKTGILESVIFTSRQYSYTYLEDTLLHLVTESTSDENVERDVRPVVELDL